MVTCHTLVWDIEPRRDLAGLHLRSFVQMSGPETTDSPQLKLVHSLIEAFRRRDVDYLATLLHKDHRRIYYPRSLGIQEQTKEGWLKHVTEFIGLWTSCEVIDTGFQLLEPPSHLRFTLIAHRRIHH